MRSRIMLIAAIIAVAGSDPTVAQPVIALEGKWEGTCELGAKSVNTNVFIDQKGAHLNGIAATRFLKGDWSVEFDIPGRYVKIFKGSFSKDTSELKGKLIAQGKTADCKMDRKITDPDYVCLRNMLRSDIWWFLSPGNPDKPVRLGAGSTDRGRGKSGGKLCWDETEGAAKTCQRSLPQSSYAC